MHLIISKGALADELDVFHTDRSMIGQCAVNIPRNSRRLIQLNHALVRQGGAADQIQVTVIDDGAAHLPISCLITNAIR